jgi:hypothetical protein
VKRLTLAGLGMAALAALSIATGSAAAPTHHLSLRAKPDPVVFGKSTRLSGKLTGKNNNSRSVAVQQDPYPYDHFANAGSATTDAQGDYALSTHPARNTRYRAKVGSTTSSIVIERVRIRTSLRLSDSTPAAGHRVRFFGRACPQHDGATVRIQRFSRTKHRWVTKRRTVLRDIPGSTCSKYSKRLRVFHDGTFRTVVVSNDKAYANGISRRRHINAH